MRAVYSVGHDLPYPRSAATAKLVHWLTNNAVWNGNRYTDREIPEEFQPEGYTPTWCEDIALLRAQHCFNPLTDLPTPSVFLCVCGGGVAPVPTGLPYNRGHNTHENNSTRLRWSPDLSALLPSLHLFFPAIPLYQCMHVFLCVCGGVVAPSTR